MGENMSQVADQMMSEQQNSHSNAAMVAPFGGNLNYGQHAVDENSQYQSSPQPNIIANKIEEEEF